MSSIPNVHQAEPIPSAARDAIDDLLQSGDLLFGKYLLLRRGKRNYAVVSAG